MRNSPVPPWQTPVETRWSIDALPRVRVGVLFLVFLLPVVAIAGRLYWLQVVIPDRFLATWSQTTETFETLPATDGRILSSDGQVLAMDQPHYEVHVHYRWLEDPVNNDWLTARAKDRLPKAQRRDKVRVEAARKEVLAEREALWQSLAQVTGLPSADLLARRQEIQKRIEAMRASVAARRAERSLPALAPTASWWERVQAELTTPPDRGEPAPLILKEELSAHRLIADLPVDRVAFIESQPSLFPGVEVQPASHRVYPQDALAAHLIGLRAEIGKDQWLVRQARYPQGDPLALEVGDRVGETGLERTYDHHLRGARGLQRIVRDHAGQIIEQEVTRPPRTGRDLTLTIDADLQQQAERALDAVIAGDSLRGTDPALGGPPLAGSVVVMDLRQGDVLIAASGPRISLPEMQHPSKQQWSEWTSDPGRPFVARVTQAAIPPGSLFQIVTAIAALETGCCSPEERLTCPGFLNEPGQQRCPAHEGQPAGHGEITLADAVGRSCHLYFFDAAERLGPRPIGDWAAQLGFGSPTGIDLLGEQSGQIPGRAGTTQATRWPLGTTRQFANGQAGLTVTPLQVARLMAIIGNGGYAVTPRLTPDAPEPSSGSSTGIELASAEVSTASRRGPPLLTDRTLQTIRRSLEFGAYDSKASGLEATLPGLRMAGKIGVASSGKDRPEHLWFAGYVPADRPRYAFAVSLEQAGSDPQVIAGVTRRVMMALVEAGLLSAE